MTSRYRHMVALGAALLAGALLLWSPGCKSKKQEESSSKAQIAAVDLHGLEAIPSEASALVGMNVGALRGSWLVQRMVEQMFRRDPELETRIRALMASCKVDLETGMESVVIGLTRGSAPDSGDNEAVMVVTGAFVEAELASCVGQSVAADGRSLIADRVEGRSFYGVRRDVVPVDQAAGPARDAGAANAVMPPMPGDQVGAHVRDQVWFALASPDTLVVATSKDFLRRALGSGDKIGQRPGMAELLQRTDRGAGFWVAGEIDPAIGQGLVDQASGAIARPPRAMFGAVQLRAGLDIKLGVEMATDDDAQGLESLIAGQKGLWALAAQRFGLGAWIDKLGVDADARIVYLTVSLNQDELRQVLARIDTSGGSEQNPADTEGGP